jgi:hypothetical protein
MATHRQSRRHQQLVEFFHERAYIRWQNPQRFEKDRPQYKKGDEVRFIAYSKRELAVIARLLRAAGFKPGRPFVKGRQFRLPLYGREAVSELLAFVREQS